MAEIVSGTIVNISPDGLTIKVPYSNIERFAKRGYRDVLVELPDSRRKTPEQRKKAWAIMADIAQYQFGVANEHTRGEVYKEQRQIFALQIWKKLQRQSYHISEQSVTDLGEFITYLVDFCIENAVPTKEPLQNNCEDIARYVYACAKRKVCAACGKDWQHAHVQVDIHHVDRVGMGRNRDDMVHIGMQFLPLCRTCHQEAHRIGDADFCELYHLEPIEVDETIASKYKLGKK